MDLTQPCGLHAEPCPAHRRPASRRAVLLEARCRRADPSHILRPRALIATDRGAAGGGVGDVVASYSRSAA